MGVLLSFTTLTSILFAVVSIFLYLNRRKINFKIALQEAAEKQKVYELSILKQIQEKIGYSLDYEYIVEVIIGNLKHLFNYTTASSMVIKNNHIYFKTYAQTPVSTKYQEQVKKSMLMSLTSLVPYVPIQIEEQIVGSYVDQNNNTSVISSFNIPLEIANHTVGIINVSSVNKELYDEAQTDMLRQIVSQASGALTKLQDVLVTEKGKLTSMISSLADGVFMVDTDNNLLIINNSAKQFLRLSSKEPVFTDIISAFGTQYNIVDKIKQASNTNQQLNDKEISLNDKVFQMFVTPVLDPSDINKKRTIGASVLMHDITVEQNINKIKEDFTHMMVHELRAPLTAIKDSSELMIDQYHDENGLAKEQQEKLIEIIDKQSKNLLEQINQILDAAKIEAGKFTINKTPSDIGQIVQDTIDTFLPQAQKRQIILAAEISQSLPKIEVDPIRISQVLTNLLSNSLKFTPPNGRITTTAVTEGDYVVVSVKDTGMGIPESEQKDLFSKYYQVKTTPHQLTKKGTGLGLFITKGIVEAHGGMVGINSKANEGATIYFKLPIKATNPEVINEHFPTAGANSASSMVN